MCGIFAAVSKTKPNPPSNVIRHLLENRGPHHSDTLSFDSSSRGGELLTFTSTVLALRGADITPQPLQDPCSGSVLCWNGEAWNIGGRQVEGNDGQAVLGLLTSCSKKALSRDNSMTALRSALGTIAGPFAFVYFDKSHSVVYFGRDRLGRRSLLYSHDEASQTFELSSVAEPGADNVWKEVEADAVYALILGSPNVKGETKEFGDCGFRILSYAWNADIQADEQVSLASLNRTLPSENEALKLSSNSVEELRQHLYRSLTLRTLDIPFIDVRSGSEKVRLAVLFSGGLDCTVLARIVHDILPPDQEVDLLNVAFENPRVVAAANKLEASKDRLQNSTGVKKIFGNNESPYEKCPDRVTGRASLAELRSVCPLRIWRFVEINVPYIETLAHREMVKSLIHPHKTEMDLSIAYALYFAARGTGKASVAADIPPTDYSTPAPVLLSGLGADELFGGYIRHATAFERRGFAGILDELNLDVNRLGKRNLGRDDRVISNSGREARYPYLDEKLVKWALETPISAKCGFRQSHDLQDIAEPAVESGKKVLRLVAWDLGMHLVAKETKRAVRSRVQKSDESS